MRRGCLRVLVMNVWGPALRGSESYGIVGGAEEVLIS